MIRPGKQPTACLILLTCCLLALSFKYLTVVSAQSSCTTSNTPGTLPQTFAWPQNALVSVNISGFTQAEFDCLKLELDSYNLINGATQGNGSGVRFSVTNNGPSVASVNANGKESTPPESLTACKSTSKIWATLTQDRHTK